MASAQKCGGVQKNITPNSTTGVQLEAVRDRRPTHQHRHRAGGAADHDVLRARALQPQGVDADVEGRRRERQHRRQQVGAGPQHGEGDDLERHREHERIARRDHAGDQRTVAGADHQAVDVAVDVHVDGVGAAGGERAADQRDDHQPRRRPAALGQHHRRHRRDQQQLDDPRLGEGDVGPDRGRRGARDRRGRSRPAPTGRERAVGCRRTWPAHRTVGGSATPTNGRSSRGNATRHTMGVPTTLEPTRVEEPEQDELRRVRPSVDRARVERPGEPDELRHVRAPEAVRLLAREGDRADARRPSQGQGGGRQRLPRAGRDARLPPPRARAVGDDAEGRRRQVRRRRSAGARVGQRVPDRARRRRGDARDAPARRAAPAAHRPVARQLRARCCVVRLFPVAHPDDEEREAEYQRLMRDELVQSKLAGDRHASTTC